MNSKRFASMILQGASTTSMVGNSLTTFVLWETILVSVVSLATALILFAPKVSKATWWRATVTPLASIIGSGFLVLGPILVREFGSYAPAIMIVLCCVGYAFGEAVRFNIKNFESLGQEASKLTRTFEQISSWMLAFAYIISVSYYLNLLGSFAVSLTDFNGHTTARFVTTGVFIFIGAYGLVSGLGQLEQFEEFAVSIKLAIIAGLLLGMGLYVGHLYEAQQLIENQVPKANFHSVYLVFGLVVCVQGFETSRYLGEQYDQETRIKTMRYAQWISTLIYVVYTLLMGISFDASTISTKETAIIQVTKQIAPILPVLLVAAALAAQFSAGVADTAGCGGLVNELTKKKVSSKIGYGVVAVLGVLLTWFANVFQIISYASRAFAVYYAFQSMVACTISWRRRSEDTSYYFKSLLFLCLTLLGFAIAWKGIPVE